MAQAAEPSVSTTSSSTGGSDQVPFASAEVPTLFFTRGLEPNYHTPNDKQVNPRLLNETIQIGLDVVKQMVTPG